MKFSSSFEVSPINKFKILIAEDDEASETLIPMAVQQIGNEVISVKTADIGTIINLSDL